MVDIRPTEKRTAQPTYTVVLLLRLAGTGRLQASAAAAKATKLAVITGVAMVKPAH